MSPLLYACQNGYSSLAQLLITTNADVNKQDTRGWTVSGERGWIGIEVQTNMLGILG